MLDRWVDGEVTVEVGTGFIYVRAPHVQDIIINKERYFLNVRLRRAVRVAKRREAKYVQMGGKPR